ncbi:ParB/RepB/Spo0J family partition protein [Streptomyces sp. NPDC005548]|uniref:ParB/RepB/Spo0J family partition protein n=1 Tax=Streptomyces sp. NPDC005548 TaxID=3364724 RepID=UPI0036AE933F
MSRVADELGTGASFGRARGVSARRQAVAASTGAATAGAPDSRLKTLPLEHLVPTRFNPRRNFGTTEDLRDFGLKLKKKQLQPAVAVTRDAYLLLWPAEADSVGKAKYVIANGERRYRGSLAAGLTTLEVVVDDDIAKSRADFLDAVLSENNDREDLDPIERALGIKTMVEQLGGKAKVAEHYEKSAGWVTQQMYLLDLAPELQQLVSAGDLPVRETRALVKLQAEDQRQAWEARQVQREEERAQPRTPRVKPPPTLDAGSGAGPAQLSQTFTAVKNTTQPTPDPQATPDPSPGLQRTAETFTAVKNAPQTVSSQDGQRQQDTEPSTDTRTVLPDPRDQQDDKPGEPLEDTSQKRLLPYDDGVHVGLHLALKMEDEAHLAMLDVSLRKAWQRYPDRLNELLAKRQAERA